MFRTTILMMVMIFMASSISTQTALDYSDLSLWAAHPDKMDMADMVPDQNLSDNQADAQVDVFFVHPTTYTKKFIDEAWNAPIDNVELNAKTTNTTIKLQASIFNVAGKIYAPFYRQAHLHSYYPKKSGDRAKPAFALAFTDVEAAFDQFLKWNKGRPFIIASHSQGTQHAGMLVKKRIDGTDLQKRMVVAYLVGMPIKKDAYQSIPVCDNPSDTGCYVSWRTYMKGGGPKKGWRTQDNITVVNPITWNVETSYSDLSDHEGVVLSKYDKVIPQKTRAKIQDNVLWITRPKFFGSFLLLNKNFHVADYNMFWQDVRSNVENRVQTFLKLR